MAWYYGTFACGHEGRVNIIGPHKDREYKKEWAFSRSCPECRQKEHEEKIKRENKEASELAKEYEFPNLTGTEKQVVWANTLRMNMYKEVNKKLDHARESKKERCNFQRSNTRDFVYLFLDEMSDMIDRGFQDHTEARFWIDHQYLSEVLTVFYDEMRKRKKEESVPEDVKKELEQEEESLTSRPEGGSKTGVVKIKHEGNYINVYYPNDDVFKKIVKEHRYFWDGVWCRKITELTGEFEDRAAEIGNALLAGGFTVKFPDMETKEKAISGTYVPECIRWIKKHEEGKLSISWGEYSDKIYKAAKAIPGAHWEWNLSEMIVSAEFYNEIQTFAKKWDFRFTQKAEDVIEKYKEKEATYTVDKVSVPDEKK